MADLHAISIASPRAWSEIEFRDLLSQSGVFAITRSGALLLGRVVADEAELLTLAVVPVGRRKGTATDLITEFMTEARQRGAHHVFLEVAAENTAACALYSKCGFHSSGRRRNYYRRSDGTHHDAIIMSRDV